MSDFSKPQSLFCSPQHGSVPSHRRKHISLTSKNGRADRQHITKGLKTNFLQFSKTSCDKVSVPAPEQKKRLQVSLFDQSQAIAHESKGPVRPRHVKSPLKPRISLEKLHPYKGFKANGESHFSRATTNTRIQHVSEAPYRPHFEENSATKAPKQRKRLQLSLYDQSQAIVHESKGPVRPRHLKSPVKPRLTFEDIHPYQGFKANGESHYSRNTANTRIQNVSQAPCRAHFKEKNVAKHTTCTLQFKKRVVNTSDAARTNVPRVDITDSSDSSSENIVIRRTRRTR